MTIVIPFIVADPMGIAMPVVIHLGYVALLIGLVQLWKLDDDPWSRLALASLILAAALLIGVWDWTLWKAAATYPRAT